ncbi:MAG: hypothetical protein SFV32_05965 [Opitutaceae bacterium]|nr:hypothetical protein [Opitutaceae bacterium]
MIDGCERGNPNCCRRFNEISGRADGSLRQTQAVWLDKVAKWRSGAVGIVNIIGGSKLTNAQLVANAAAKGDDGIVGTKDGVAKMRAAVVGTHESAGFPAYSFAADGYPTTTDIDKRMLIGYAANADRYEDWLTNPKPLRDSQQPFNGVPPLNTYPSITPMSSSRRHWLPSGVLSKRRFT